MSNTKAIKLFDKVLLFVRAQCSAGCGTLVDYSTMLLLTEVFDIHYTISIVFGGILGALVNFLINMAWTFRTRDAVYKSPLKNQLIKFTIVAVNSIILKSSGTYFFTTIFNIDYRISRIVIDLLVSVVFNYGLQKNWVFKKRERIEK